MGVMARKDYFTKQILVIIKPRKDAFLMKPTRKGNVLKKDILFSKHTFPLVGPLTFGLRITLHFIEGGFIGRFSVLHEFSGFDTRVYMMLNFWIPINHLRVSS